MGMGEPMHNCRAVWDSLRGMMGVDGFGLSPRSITVSTAIGAGLLVETATRFPGVRLALSLHAADAELRKDLVPHSPSEMERTKEVVQAINEIQNGEPVWLELTMLKGVNDRPQDLESLVRFTSGLNVQVNLIPFNSMRRPLESNDGKSLPLAAQHGDLESTPLSEIYTIAQELRSRGLVVRVRHSFGDQDNAACGQLVLSSSRTPETLAEW
jgi:23S rRNA (adenine2503-C2)-methyltransferase